ncbi:MAG: class I SAM-dependent methyltransferase [Betaproteobacteria bacterium]
MNWKEYWTTQPRSVAETEFARQVGHTIGGRPYSDEQFEPMTAGLIALLDLRSTDVLLDLCCGNGLLTSRLATGCRHVIGVDFSPVLLDVARKYHQPANVEFHESDVLSLSGLPAGSTATVTRVLMHAALQHFHQRDFPALIARVVQRCPRAATIVFGCVPDRAQRWQFYNTLARRFSYVKSVLQRNSALGQWWSREYITTVCRQYGLQCAFTPAVDYHVSHYRFDVRMVRLEQGAGAKE